MTQPPSPEPAPVTDAAVIVSGKHLRRERGLQPHHGERGVPICCVIAGYQAGYEAGSARYQARIVALEEHNVKLRDTLSEYMLTTAKPAEGFKNEEDYVGWQRSMNHWEREARALLAQEVPDAKS